MMAKVARWIEIAVGLFFLISAAAKAVDMDAFGVQISAYNVVKDANVVRGSAYFALLLETALGGALLAGIRAKGLTHLASGVMIVVYSTLIAYAWAFHGLTDCGCLGAWVTMGPAASLAKNIVLLAALGFAWFGGRQASAATANNGMRFAAAFISATIMILALTGIVMRDGGMKPIPGVAQDGERPYAQFVFDADGQHFDLGKGEYLVAMLNATCEHCRASVPALNALVETAGLPPMVALMMGNEKEFADFQAQTSPLFGAHLIEPLTFMEFIGSTPPRLSHIRDGVGVRHWDWQDKVPEGEILVHFAKPGE
jgi:hypothetical protein